MRRQFQSDEEIPASIWQIFPEYKQKLNRIIEIEDRLVSAINSRKRICYAINSEPDFKTKILRVHIRHQFHPSTASDRAHYVITVEGHLLDKSIAKQLPFGNFLDKIRLQLDKRFHPSNNVYEWAADLFPEGAKGHCFRVKAYGDKPFPIKVFLYRSNDIRARYELSPNLREILPSMHVDPTEEQVLLALWTSLTTNSMMEGRDRRQVKCSPELKNLFGVEALSLATLRQKVSEHLLPARPIQVEYNVTNISSSVTTSFGPNAVSKSGGKAFDVEVDVKDPYAFDLLESVNDISRSQKEIMETISTMEQKASFLASAIIDSSNSIFSDLEKLQYDPLSLSLSLPLSSSPHSQKEAGCARDRFMDPLLITARGESSGFAMRPSLPTELLQRASEPFSLISRRSAQSTAAVRKILRPQRGSNTDNSHESDLNVDSRAAGEASSSSSQSSAMEGVKDEGEEEACGADGGGGDAADDLALPLSSASAPTSSVKTEDTADTASASSEMDVVKDDEGEKDDEMVVDDPLAVGDVQSSATLTAADSAGHDRQDEDKDKEKEGTLPPTIKEEKEGEKEGGEETSPSSAVKEEGGSDVPHAVKEEKEGEKGEEGIVDLVLVKAESIEKEKGTTDSSSTSAPSDTTTDPVKPKVEEPSNVPAIKAESTPVPAPTVTAPLKPEMLSRAPDNLSAIHSLRGFLDVGSAALFAPTEPWVLATASLLAKRKLSKSSK